jgi:hypothetical protein
MKLHHTLDMNYQRITISLPNSIYNNLILLYGKGNISKLLAESAQSRILHDKLNEGNVVEEFCELRKITTKRTIKQILDGIHEGRT